MPNIEWWPRLGPDARAGLIAHNGELVSPDIADQILATGSPTTSDAWWVGEAAPEGLYLSDAAVDWIEAAANEEPA